MAIWNIGDYIRIKNAWKPDQYINVEDSPTPKATKIKSGWWSAMWERITLTPATPYKPTLVVYGTCIG